MKTPKPRRGKGLIRAMIRRGSQSSHAPLVARDLLHEIVQPTICEKCGAVLLRKAWRRGRSLDPSFVDSARWGTCPACDQVQHGEYFGRVLVHNPPEADRKAIESRVRNVARRAEFTQPERRIVSMEWAGSTLEVLTTSQKLAHRVAKEIRKAFGGRTVYQWSPLDGSLLAVWRAHGAS